MAIKREADIGDVLVEVVGAAESGSRGRLERLAKSLTGVVSW